MRAAPPAYHVPEIKMADEMGVDFSGEEDDGSLAEPNLEIPTNVDWIYSENGRSFFQQVLETVGVQESETIESNAAREMLLKYEENIEVVTDFLKQMSASFLVCYQNAEQIKYPNRKMLNLERSFATLRDDSFINGKWSCVVCSCGLQNADGTNILLNHVLEHFWSSLVLQGLHEVSKQGDDSSSSYSSTVTQDIEVESIREHAGWVFKRVREIINAGPEIYKIPLSKADNTEVEVDKLYILSLIERLGSDVLVQPGKFLFTPIPEIVEVFVYLHNTVERIVKNQLGSHPDKDILKDCLELLSKDPQLRQMWYKILGDEDNTNFKSGCLVLLQRVVGMFLKSKQQIIRKQLQLKPNKQSSFLRQSLSKKPIPKERKQLSQSDEYVAKFRRNPTDITQVKEFLTNALSIPSQAPDVLKKLHGKELTHILECLGLPGFAGKKKQKQSDLLVTHNVDGKKWNIIFPDKVSPSLVR